jgi:3'-5' exoribonuclease
MTRRYVNQLANGDTVEDVFLAAEKQLRSNRQGGLYLHMELRDRTGSIGARLWNATESMSRMFEPGDYILTRGKVQLYQGTLQLIVSSVQPVGADSIDAEDFTPRTSQSVPKLLSRLRELLLGLREPHLRALAECFLIDGDFIDAFSSAPAGVRNHHAYQGGLLEHVVNLMNVADRISEFYPDVDRDLLMAGIFLHDIGKVLELSFDRGFAYTDEGQLLGHLVQGVELVSRKVAKAEELIDEPFPAELLLRLKHMIVSHHGTAEFGAVKLPMTPEAIMLHHLDSLDAKVNTFTREIREDPSVESSWTAYNTSLGRRLFKGSTGGQGSNGVDSEE